MSSCRKYSKRLNILENEWLWGSSITVIARDGFASGKISFDKENDYGYITDIITSKNERRQGRAKQILALLELLAFEKGKKRIVRLGANPNDWTYQWYLRSGYKDTGDFDPKLGYNYLEKYVGYQILPGMTEEELQATSRWLKYSGTVPVESFRKILLAVRYLKNVTRLDVFKKSYAYPYPKLRYMLYTAASLAGISVRKAADIFCTSAEQVSRGPRVLKDILKYPAQYEMIAGRRIDSLYYDMLEKCHLANK